MCWTSVRTFLSLREKIKKGLEGSVLMGICDRFTRRAEWIEAILWWVIRASVWHRNSAFEGVEDEAYGRTWTRVVSFVQALW